MCMSMRERVFVCMCVWGVGCWCVSRYILRNITQLMVMPGEEIYYPNRVLG